MWLDVHIPKNNDIPFDVKKIAKMEGLDTGIIGCKPVVVKDMVGKFTRLYDPYHLGVALEIHEEEKTIDISLNYPAGRRDIKTFFYLIEEICTMYHTSEFYIYDELVSVYNIEDVIDFYIDSLPKVLKNIFQEMIDGKRQGYIAYGALYPIVFGLKDFELIQDDVKEFVLTIQDYQNMDVHYTEADIYTVYRNKKHYGAYEIKLDTPCVLPKDPYLMVNTFDCELYEWVVRLPFADFRFEDFMNLVPAKRFDEEHVIVNLSYDDIQSLAKQIGYDPIEDKMIYSLSYGIPFMDGITHARKVHDKNLETDYYNGYLHVAYFLKWCMEHGLLNEHLLEDNPNIESDFLNSDDIRKHICDSKVFQGRVCPYHLNEFGRKFASIYGVDHKGCYPEQVDKVTEQFMGTEEYNNPDYKTEAYLFMKDSKEYYQALSNWLDDKWKEFIGTFN